MSEKKVSLDKELKNYAAIPAYPLANYILPYMGCNVKIITAYCDNIMNIIQ